ncbi:MAG: hypothetical protein CM1200mP30_11820 [Pseudomonadota bacterium]|nr:MAG: hypothetical protein CM1200mP30_11820 [Pseudomonadota bacterium]
MKKPTDRLREKELKIKALESLLVEKKALFDPQHWTN